VGEGIETWFAAGTWSPGWNACVAQTCIDSYHIEGDSCRFDNPLCLIAGDGFTTVDGAGQRFWNGTNYGPCLLSYCYDNFAIPYSGACYLASADCYVEGASGVQYFDGFGSYSECILDFCYDPEREVVGGVCLVSYGYACIANADCANNSCYYDSWTGTSYCY
jgi:hypothetical protein